MPLDDTPKHPIRLQRSALSAEDLKSGHAVFVGPGTKWANPFKKADTDALRGETDVEAAYQRGGWREAAKLLYREHLRDEGLDPTELRGKDLVCTCKLTDPCHADVLLELANGNEASADVKRAERATVDGPHARRADHA